MVVKVIGAVGEDVHVRRQSGNALNFAAATTVKRKRCTDCIVFHDIHFIFIIYIYYKDGVLQLLSKVASLCRRS